MTDFRPGNYSVHFMEDMDTLHPTAPKKWVDNLKWLCRKMERGQHFQMPDDGRIIEMKDMPEEMPLFLRPPFPVTVIEYSSNAETGDDLLNCVKSSRRIVVALDHSEVADVPHKMMLAHTGGEPSDGVWIVPIAYTDAMTRWAPPSCIFFIPYDQQVTKKITRHAEVAAKLGIGPSDERSGLEMSVAALAIEIFDGSTGQLTTPQAMEHMIGCCAADAQAELFAYQQMAVALACSNVTTEKREPHAKLNKSRGKSGKRSLFDYHVLTIPGATGSSQSDASGRQVRSHLRRGHIRRIQSGRIIWINATLVKGGSNGFVAKSYAVEGPA